MCMYLYIPYRCKVEQPDALQHNARTNSETLNVHVEVRSFVRELGSCFP